MRRWLCSSLVGGLLLCGGCGAPTSVGFIAKVPAVALIVGSELDPYEAALVSSARCEAKTSKVRLVVTMADDPRRQADAIGQALSRSDKAIIVAPVDYLGVYLLLRTAHDRQIPSFVLDLDPPPATDQAYVWSFLSGDRPGALDLAVRHVTSSDPLGGEVLVVRTGNDSRSIASAQAALEALRRDGSARQVRSEFLAISDAAHAAKLVRPGSRGQTRILAVDEASTDALVAANALLSAADRASITGIGIAGTQVDAVRRHALGAIAVSQPRALGQRAVDYAVSSFNNAPDLIPRHVRLTSRLVTPDALAGPNIDAGCAGRSTQGEASPAQQMWERALCSLSDEQRHTDLGTKLIVV